MNKYICEMCGYEYDEESGVKWDDLPDDWVCPDCASSKELFDCNENNIVNEITPTTSQVKDSGTSEGLSFTEMGALCSNLSKGCDKQYRSEEAKLFNKLSLYFDKKGGKMEDQRFDNVSDLINDDLQEGYRKASEIIKNDGDRGALRALVWGEKVTKILKSILMRYEKKQNGLIENTNIYVCEICGFVYIGNEAPLICPICKVPNMKIVEIKRGR